MHGSPRWASSVSQTLGSRAGPSQAMPANPEEPKPDDERFFAEFVVLGLARKHRICRSKMVEDNNKGSKKAITLHAFGVQLEFKLMESKTLRL